MTSSCTPSCWYLANSGGQKTTAARRTDTSSRSLWWGSANWTTASPQHLETGFWSDDEALVAHAKDFVSSVIAFSEPWDSAAVGPEPNRGVEVG